MNLLFAGRIFCTGLLILGCALPFPACAAVPGSNSGPEFKGVITPPPNAANAASPASPAKTNSPNSSTPVEGSSAESAPPARTEGKNPLFAAHATAGLPFGGHGSSVHKDFVRSIAQGKAYLAALRQAAHGLGASTAAHIGAFDHDQRRALAASVYTPEVLSAVSDPLPDAAPNAPAALPQDAHKKSTAPPRAPAAALDLDDSQQLTVMITLKMPASSLDARIRQSLQEPDTLSLYAKVLHSMDSLTVEGADLVQRAALMRENRGMHADEIFVRRISHLADQLDALWIYLRALPALHSIWEDPAQTVSHMRRALTLAPHNALLWCALGESQLQLDLPQKALESLNKAVDLDASLARALYARGLAHFRMQQSALAEKDLSAALALRPDNSQWLRARGAVRMVREDYPPMCDDFAEACALGDCDGLMAARKRLLCMPEGAAAPKPAAETPPAEGSHDAP